MVYTCLYILSNLQTCQRHAYHLASDRDVADMYIPCMYTFLPGGQDSRCTVQLQYSIVTVQLQYTYTIVGATGPETNLNFVWIFFICLWIFFNFQDIVRKNETKFIQKLQVFLGEINLVFWSWQTITHSITSAPESQMQNLYVRHSGG